MAKQVIHLVIKDKKKTILDREVELKDLNIDDVCEYEDLMIEHTQALSSETPLANIYKRTLKLIRLATNLTDNEIMDIGRDGRMKLFQLIVEQTEKKNTKS